MVLFLQDFSLSGTNILKTCEKGANPLQKEENNRIRVDIYGTEYQLRGNASVQHMRLVAGLVDDKMREIARGNARLDLNRLAVLAAVNIADEYMRLRQEYEELLKLLERSQERPQGRLDL
jgi:cell division protein ZapA